MGSKERENLISIQPYFVLGEKKFCQRIYVKDGISHFFSFTNTRDEDIVVPLMVDSCCNLIFEYKDGTVRTHLIGITVEKRTFSIKKGAEYFGVRLQPSAIKFVREYQPKEILGNIIILDELPSTKEMCTKMAVQTDFDSRIKTFLEEYGKFQNIGTENKKSALFRQILELIIERKGMVKVSQLEELSGYTSRYINKIFDRELGMNAKQMCSLVKFQFLLSDMNDRDFEKLTDYAAEYEYYDQAHFIHDFKECSGKTPREYVRVVEESRYKENIRNA